MDLSFAIPVKIDSKYLLQNLSTVLRFLTTQFKDAEILVIEQDIESNLEKISIKYPDIKFFFMKQEGYFSKSKAINLGILNSTRKYFCMYDADVLISPEAINKSINILNKKNWRIVVPFNRIFIDVQGKLRENIINNPGNYYHLLKIKRVKDIPESTDITSRILHGGIVLADKEILEMEGGFNKKMISYGWEDTEFFKRFEKLGYQTKHINSNNIIHLGHERDSDSRPNEMYDKNKCEYLLINSMDRKKLKNYVDKELSIVYGYTEKRQNIRKNQHRRNILFALKLRSYVNKLHLFYSIYGIREFSKRIIFCKLS